MFIRVFQASGGQRVTSVKKVRGARLSQGEERVKKNNNKTSTHAVPPRAFSSARLKIQNKIEETMLYLVVFKCFYLPCSIFKTFKNSKSFSCSHLSLHRQIYKPSFNRAHCF